MRPDKSTCPHYGHPHFCKWLAIGPMVDRSEEKVSAIKNLIDEAFKKDKKIKPQEETGTNEDA